MGIKRIISLIVLILSLMVITSAMFVDTYWPVLLIVGMYLNTVALLTEFSFQKSEGSPKKEYWQDYKTEEPTPPVAVKPIPPPPPPSIKCRICQNEFKNVTKLKEHFLKQHFNMIEDTE